MGKISLNTRSSPTSSRSRAAASVCSRVSNARTCTSRRLGCSIPATSLPNETIGLFTVAKWVSLLSDVDPEAGSANDPDRKPRRGRRAVRIYVTGCVRAIDSAGLKWDRPSLAPTFPGRSGDRRRRLPRADADASARGRGRPLLQLDRSALLLELGLDRVGLVLRHTLLDRLGRAVDQVLRLLQPQAGDLADHLDHLDLLLAGALQHDGELRLLLDGRGGGAATGTRRGGNGHGGRGGHAELLLERLHEFRKLENGHVADRVEQLVTGKRSHLSGSF